MASLSKHTAHRSHPLNRRMLRTGIALMAVTLLLAACGGTKLTITPASPTAATIPATATVAASIGQTGVSPTIAPSATVSTAATQTAPIAIRTPVASIAAAATKPTTGTNANAGSAAGKADPCMLVTKADYLAVMGDAASDPEKNDRPAIATSGFSQSSCDYKIAAGGKVEFVTVNVMQRDASAPARIDMKTYWEGTKKAWVSMQSKVTPLPEIGPEVFLVVNPLLEQIGAGGAVHFFKGDVVFDVQVATGSGTVDEQNAAGTVAAKKLATIAFGKL